MKKKKILTPNLKSGMITAEEVYDFSNRLIISTNTELDNDIIDPPKPIGMHLILLYF